ncbi:hypothetical protein Purlil1_4786 [Purpureocillium lilacinum]|uniref:Uncharacterized protein n=1 Tax=Purpureocillium lilacinum TaxID=33203 RepID=A0ABR0C357_PURLI|nr:hypothetical protein Purlil1_4786 [Purpureocillium lilacinum]
MPTKKAGQLPGEAELLGQLLGIAVVRGRSSWVVVPVVPSAAARRNPGRSAEAQPPPAARETWTLSRPSAARGQQTRWDGDPAGCKLMAPFSALDSFLCGLGRRLFKAETSMGRRTVLSCHVKQPKELISQVRQLPAGAAETLGRKLGGR